MIKNIAIFCILAMLVSINAYSQNLSIEEAMLLQRGISGVGITKIDDDTYYRMQLQPDFNFGKVGFGLDFVLLYNPDEDEFRAEDGEKWDSFSDYLRAIRYIRYGHKGTNEFIYCLYGALDYARIGHGTIMEGYSNYDRRGLCLDLNFSDGMYGIETVLNNLADPNIFGGRLYVRPLKKSEIPIIKNFTLGTTYIVDQEPVYASMVDNEGNKIMPAEDEIVPIEDLNPLAAFGVDIGIPILQHPALKIQVYDDLVLLKYQNKIGEDETGKGNVAGIGTEILGRVHFKIEYRQFQEGFRPTLFNYTYEHEKTQICQIADGEDVRCGVEFNQDPLKGIYSQLNYNLMNKIFLAGAYEDYDNREPNLYLQITESGLVEKLSFSALYTKNKIEDFEDIFDLDEKSLLAMRIGYVVFKPFEIAIVREWRFRETDDERGFETIQKTSFEAGINVQF